MLTISGVVFQKDTTIKPHDTYISLWEYVCCHSLN